MKIGMLTGGGDCPGLNAVIRAVVRKGTFHYSDQFVGFLEGWRGLVEDKSMVLDLDAVSGILPRGGTILRTSRTNPSKKPDGLDRCVATIEKHKIDALIAIGGDDTLSVAQKLYERGVKVIGVPKTIDNDLAGTDFTFGFDTAVNVATEAIDRVHTTAEAHNRVIVVEVMGRDSGWIATYSGIAGGADVILAIEQGIRFAAFQHGHAFFQHIDGRIGDAAIAESGNLEIKHRRRLIGALEFIRHILIDRRGDGACRGIADKSTVYRDCLASHAHASLRKERRAKTTFAAGYEKCALSPTFSIKCRRSCPFRVKPC